MSDYTIVIQGPLNKTALNYLTYYKSLGHVVISYWATDDESILSSYDINDCTLVKQEIPENRYPYKTFTLQAIGILGGLKACQTEYVIRTRSDEFWGNLAPLIDKFEKARHKIICGNIFFKKWDNIEGHIGDHLFIGDTKLLTSTYEQICNSPKTFDNARCPEVVAAWAMLNSVKLNYTKEDFIKLFDVIDINLLIPFKACWGQMSVEYLDYFYYLGVINNIEEL